METLIKMHHQNAVSFGHLEAFLVLFDVIEFKSCFMQIVITS